jgi:hypothetical protein
MTETQTSRRRRRHHVIVVIAVVVVVDCILKLLPLQNSS